MLEFADTRPDCDVQEAEYARLLGFPRGHKLEGQVRELADWARAWYAAHGRPWIYVRESESLDLADDRLVINGMKFTSQQLHDQFAAAEANLAALVVVSAGSECEAKARELWQAGRPDEYFFLEIYGSAVVEHLIMVANGRICAWADSRRMVALPHYSPGYSGWDVSNQCELWALIRSANNGKIPGPLQVLDTGMLRPKKSLLAVVGITANLGRAQQFVRLVPCENCSLPGCQYRRAPYRRTLPQIENVHQLQRSSSETTPGRPAPDPLARPASYSTNPRALRKWSQERLSLTTLSDGSIEARFRYEGTTCTSLGRSLEFDYRIILSSPQDGYRITDANCTPAPGDTGHTHQCEYLNDAASLMGSIASEKPLLGRPLNDVLYWERPPSPSGCYCDIEKRNHKWALVFEVIHFALVQRELDSPPQGRR